MKSVVDNVLVLSLEDLTVAACFKTTSSYNQVWNQTQASSLYVADGSMLRCDLTSLPRTDMRSMTNLWAKGVRARAGIPIQRSMTC